MLKFYVRHGMIVDKTLKIISFKQKNGWKFIKNLIKKR